MKPGIISFLLFALLALTSCMEEKYSGCDFDITFDSLAADGSDRITSTVLILEFDRDIETLRADNISIDAGATGVTGGTLNSLGNGKYELSLSNITATGQITVSVSRNKYSISPASRTTTVYYYTETPVAFDSLEADGSEEETSTKLTLHFSADIEGLAVGDIILQAGITGAVAEELTRIDQGKYELELSGVSGTGEVSLSVSKYGYGITPSSRTVKIHKAVPRYDISGTVKNATDNGAIEGVTVMLRSGHNVTSGEYLSDGTADISVVTQADGTYTIRGIQDGEYTIEFSKSGYIAAYLNITVAGAALNDQNVYLSEVLADDQYRVVVRWRTDRSIDLDSHLTGILPNNSGFRVYYNSKTLSYGGETIAVLDTDSRTTGPETLTFTVPAGSTFVYWIFNFDQSPYLEECRPHIDVYKGSTLIDSYDAADYNDAGNSIRWKVFRIDDSGYTPLHIFDNQGAPSSGTI